MGPQTPSPSWQQYDPEAKLPESILCLLAIEAGTSLRQMRLRLKEDYILLLRPVDFLRSGLQKVTSIHSGDISKRH